MSVTGTTELATVSEEQQTMQTKALARDWWFELLYLMLFLLYVVTR